MTATHLLIIVFVCIVIALAWLVLGATRAEEAELASDCAKYLAAGPPDHMTDYVPESLTEIVIAHCAESKRLDTELKELAGIILAESASFDEIEDDEIREYMKSGAELVSRVLQAQR